MRRKTIFAGLIALSAFSHSFSQSKHWQNNDRELHYKEDKGDFLLVNGKYRFNRALYGDNRASRVEAGDLPEFALYLPGMGGNLQFVIQKGNSIKKLIQADNIETRYRPGSMLYTIKDPILGNGSLKLTVLAQSKEEGLVLKMETENIDSTTKIYAVYGGASGKTFNRNGDIGADPESGFYLLPEYCEDNQFKINKNQFELTYLNKKKENQYISGSFSNANSVQLTDAKTLENLSNFTQNKAEKSPIIYATYSVQKNPGYIQIKKGKSDKNFSDEQLAVIFKDAEQSRLNLINRIQLKTPDSDLNNFGATLAVAADGVWESPTFLHGAVAWRMRLNAWRGAYAADVLSWHDRAKEHFESYSNSQVLKPDSAPVEMDTLLHLARHKEKMGTSVFSSGYISRNPNDNSKPHHYDMNLVFFDQMFSHFNYTGNIEFLKKMWPTMVRHMDWEKRNFKRGDLYDAYAAIWASDALQYSGGKVTHTSAYNYRANREMAKLAKIIGENPQPYEKEADSILKAMKNQLWIKNKGYFAEFKDALGNQILHDKPGIWSIYHVSDAYILNEFEDYQNTQYINNYIPKIPVRVKGEVDKNYYTLSTTNWQPYDWSINNVALAENLQTALAYWQSGRNEDAFRLWKGNLAESMYYGISPGNFEQLSHYDAFRGELYRDFADPIGVAARTLTEGLFGVYPKLLENKINIKPGFPKDWNFAELKLPDWEFKFNRNSKKTNYWFKSNFTNPISLEMLIPVNYTKIKSVKVNGKKVKWSIQPNSILQPFVKFETEKAKEFTIEINYSGEELKTEQTDFVNYISENLQLNLDPKKKIQQVYDPQELIKNSPPLERWPKVGVVNNKFELVKEERKGTFFVQLEQNGTKWWQPVNIDIQYPLEIKWVDKNLQIQSKSSNPINGKLKINGFVKNFSTQKNQNISIGIPQNHLSKGTNSVELEYNEIKQKLEITDWEIENKGEFNPVSLASKYNERVTEIFNQKYLSPRLNVPTLQLPWQGIGNWCYPLTTTQIDDSGLMKKRKSGKLEFLGIPFLINNEDKNIVFTSQWDNFPKSVEIPVSGKGSKIYFLMAGSTNPMQSQITNGTITVQYSDGSSAKLELKNPINWWPIEQDLFDDNFAFEIPDDKIPYRVQLKTGELYKGGSLTKYSEIKGVSNRAVEGGAATILDLPIDPNKELKSIKLTAVSNDVVIGLMSATVLK
ncbi:MULTISPECIES: DUF4450 domain-containing protein [Chryseobacterium]|uniref:Alpha-L-rhamnosidase six-hairpin glycosidase domain-containing protein n=1 Tax=Chryseobacterium geocarposphaerae TaxID=1416776 RepID=A0ABU1L8W5_9FLAO|nr:MULTISPECIES: DUF4450 domain-containing protein [Chryseobacterium]MDR6403158.1 hypothetical protein [Chryseobacterium geocarposphaerae]MDR6696713.1 hypothetical protein [Chryseobacterium ginsenosidimutans]